MVSERVDEDYSSSDDESSITNGMKNTVITNGVANGDDATKTPGEPIEVGMQCGLKHLYSGKEDKRGRFQWTENVPDDVGKPAEDAETAKWALLVRNVKVYNDPRKVLAIHSIVVQSPLLKKMLEVVLKDYPGVTVGLQRLEFSGKFEPIIHRWAELKKAIDKLGDETEDERKTKEHAELFYNLLKEEFKSLIETSQDMKSKGVMTFEHLWTLFQPGATIYARQDGQETAMKLHETKYGQDRNGNPCFWLTCKYVDWDGAKFGTNKLNLSIPAYSGTRHITQLAVYPIDYHSDKEALRTRLIERGAKAESLAGSHYKSYHGIGWKRGTFGTKDKYNIKSRIVIDTYGWNRFNPSFAIFVTPLNHKDPVSVGSSGGDGEDDEGEEVCDADNDDSGMPIDGHFADEDDDSRRIPLTTEQKLICTPLLRGYSLKNKLWLNFFVNCVKEIEWQTGAFDSLVLPANQKELILGFTESQRKYKESFDDVIEGKGKGIILLLCGPPGVGKTLTAESVAEEMQVPLYMMSAGDLGLDPRNVETKLQNILEMCTKWNAILLLDEADVFLEQRSLHELERNKLVSIFLRILEYYEGIMFLTTNRVNTFDPAFQSRIHISLDYPELSIDSRRMVWKNFLAASQQANTITDRQVDQLSLMNMNGRQIKNVLKTAQLLASRKEAKLSYDHVMTVLDVTQHLHNSTQENERTRASIFC
ncbi:P-loop containing nucleoside triphosphate hydrolase protein [Lepidopterella palustris CBS 459.81]|uniref:P-loop containing nucleoside triphosphate hydrolase protein n=1 Tax=Lepidopterella palustris CBS 459.81 TaxID=1314670 RepID=A0A8E2EH93_9PEZI|nr:P-loop containing nucleoside triphosphate hydrolase protein [Lepidopterella palustris CBS 459.81]